MTNVQVHYLGNDLNTAIYPEASRVDFDESKIEWTSGASGVSFDHVLVDDIQLDELGIIGTSSGIPTYSYIYAFYKQKSSGVEIIYLVDEMTDKFMKENEGTATFNGIRMKKEDGRLYFNYSDLRTKNIYLKE